MTLHEAIRKGNFEEVKRLVEEGADINEVEPDNTDEDTPLRVAINEWVLPTSKKEEGKAIPLAELVDFLLQNGADPNLEVDGEPLLIKAIDRLHKPTHYEIAWGSDSPEPNGIASASDSPTPNGLGEGLFSALDNPFEKGVEGEKDGSIWVLSQEELCDLILTLAQNPKKKIDKEIIDEALWHTLPIEPVKIAVRIFRCLLEQGADIFYPTDWTLYDHFSWNVIDAFKLHKYYFLEELFGFLHKNVRSSEIKEKLFNLRDERGNSVFQAIFRGNHYVTDSASIQDDVILTVISLLGAGFCPAQAKREFDNIEVETLGFSRRELILALLQYFHSSKVLFSLEKKWQLNTQNYNSYVQWFLMKDWEMFLISRSLIKISIGIIDNLSGDFHYDNFLQWLPKEMFNEVAILVFPIKKYTLLLALHLRDKLVLDFLCENSALWPPGFLEERDGDGYTALILAAEYNDRHIKYFLEKGSCLEASIIDSYGGKYTALTIAVLRRHEQAAIELLRAGAKPPTAKQADSWPRDKFLLLWLVRLRINLLTEKITRDGALPEVLLEEIKQAYRKISGRFFSEKSEARGITSSLALESELISLEERLEKLEERYPYVTLSSSPGRFFGPSTSEIKRKREACPEKEGGPSTKKTRPETDNTYSASFDFFP